MTAAVMQQRLGATITGRGDRAIVFGNGIGTSQQTWRFVVQAIEAQTRIVRYDNVCSPVAPAGEYRAEAYGSIYGYVDDLIGLLDELDIRDACYVGHSISGMIGLLAAIAAPERISRLMLVCSSPRFLEDVDFRNGFPRDVIDGMLSAMRADFVGWSREFGATVVGPGASEAEKQEFIALLSAMRPEIAFRVFQTMFLSDFRAVLPRVTQPVTVVHSPYDVAVPYSAGEFLVQQLPSATLVPLRSRGHVPQLTDAPEIIAAITQMLAA